MLCELSVKSCSMNGNLFTVSLLKVEQALQSPLADHMLTAELSVISRGGKNPQNPRGHGQYEMKLEASAYPEGTCSLALLTRVFSLQSRLMYLLAVQGNESQSFS